MLLQLEWYQVHIICTYKRQQCISLVVDFAEGSCTPQRLEPILLWSSVQKPSSAQSGGGTAWMQRAQCAALWNCPFLFIVFKSSTCHLTCMLLGISLLVWYVTQKVNWKKICLQPAISGAYWRNMSVNRMSLTSSCTLGQQNSPLNSHIWPDWAITIAKF